MAFAIETDKYYICCLPSEPHLGNLYYYIKIIDQDFTLRSYLTAILTGTSCRGNTHARPENAFVTADGTKLIYTATVKEDVYYTDENGKRGLVPVQQKGIYTVTMDLKTGKQTYIRDDLK